MKIACLFMRALLVASLIDCANAQPQPAKPVFFPSSRLLPPDGMYLAPAQSSVGTANGIIISNFVHRGFTLGMPAPPAGTSATFSYDAQIEFDLAVNGGGTFTHVSLPATALISLNGRPLSGGQQTYDTELLQLQITGNAPGGVMLRESPDRSSIGQATIQSSSGGDLISSFFDIFLDVSSNGGQTWAPLNPAQHVELRVDPQTVAPVPEPSPLWPPPDDQLVMRAQDVALFTGGVRVKGLRQAIFSQAIDASQLGAGSAGQTLALTSMGSLQVSVDNGKTFTAWAGPVTLGVTIQKTQSSAAHLFDTEMVQLDISGNLPGGLMFRESPTLSSYGGALIRPGDGTFEAASFFDVWVELSSDGGQTWAAATTGPLHLEMQGNSPRGNFASSNLPPPDGEFAVLIGLLRTYPTGGSGVQINGGTLTSFSSSSPPPKVGETLIQNFTARATLPMSFDGGITWTVAVASASAKIQVRPSTIIGGNVAYYDTEMLKLDINGLPHGAMLRESPTLASLGRASILPYVTGGFRMDGFFDLNTEMSVNNGQSWNSANEGSATTAWTPAPPEAPLRIFCPSDITVPATSSSGAVVTFLELFSMGDCPILPEATVTCAPPSGSTFPIGTTTVTCEGHNGCGEHPTCTFQVRVEPSLAYVVRQVIQRAFWPPIGGMYLSPPQFGGVSAGGILFSNLTLQDFLNNVPPPPPGESLTLSVPFDVELDWSLDGGITFTHGSAPGSMTANLQNLGALQAGGDEVHQMQILRLDISGGNLPAGLKIRQSPTLPSTGQTALTPTGGAFRMGSYFDVFLEVSTDGGIWMPAAQAAHFEFRMDPANLTRVPEFTPLFPPPDDQLVSPPELPAMFTGLTLKNLRQILSSQVFDATLLGISSVPAVQRFTAQMDLQWSVDGGQTFITGHAPALIGLTVQKVQAAAVHVFDTELIQLDLSGGDLPAIVKIRQSASQRSFGETALEPLSDGTFRMSGFFDVWFEASIDGGRTWLPALSGPIHLEHQGNGLRSQFAAALFPPSGGQYQWSPGALSTYHIGASNLVVMSGNLRNFTESFQPPPPGQTSTQSFRAQMDLQLSTDGGQTFNPYTAVASVQTQLTGNNTINWGDAQFYDAEMLSLTLSGGALPPGLMLRESPTLASPGRATILPYVTGGFRMDGFFDINTEMSLNGGQSWNSAVTGPITSSLHPPSPFAPYVITCPSNITVYASSPSGAVVNYSLPPILIFPDCPFCCFGATCTPPSGSLFPIGTTTVHCLGHDGCGENPTCSFTVTVKQPFIYGGLVQALVGKAVLQTFQSVTGAPVSLIVSNLGPGAADGFHIDLGQAESLRLNFQPFLVTDLTDIVSTATGPAGTAPDFVLGTSEFAGGTNPLVRADFSAIGSTSVVVQVRDEKHQVVSSAILANNQWVNINSLFPPPCTNANKTAYTYWQGPDYAWYRFCVYGCNCQGTNCYTERTVCFRARAPLPLRPGVLSGLDLRISGAAVPASLTIQSEDIGKFGNLHEALGNATLESDTGLLAVNNLGATGLDGVAVNLNNVQKVDLALAPTRLLAQGACLNLNAASSFGLLLPAVQTANVSFVNAGGALQLNGNFSGLGATMVRVEIFLNSQFQGGVTLPAGPLGALTITGNLIGCDALAQPVGGIWAQFDSAFSFTSANNHTIRGDQIRIWAANPAKRATGLSQFSLQGCNLGQIAILGETVPPGLNTTVRLADGSVRIAGQGVAGAVYRLEATGDLGAQPSWQTVNSAEADVDGSFELTDPNTNNPLRQFYRAVTP